jgi:hypothetical protein
MGMFRQLSTILGFQDPELLTDGSFIKFNENPALFPR